MGGVSRVVSGSVFVFAVLEENDESGVLCIICIWFGDNDYRYDCTQNTPGNYAIADQLRAIAMLFGLVIVPVVSLFTPKPEKELVESTFACYDKTTVVAQKTALGK